MRPMLLVIGMLKRFSYQRDLVVILPREAIRSYDEEHAAVLLRYMDGKIARGLPAREVAARVADG